MPSLGGISGKFLSVTVLVKPAAASAEFSSNLRREFGETRSSCDSAREVGQRAVALQRLRSNLSSKLLRIAAEGGSLSSAAQGRRERYRGSQRRSQRRGFKGFESAPSDRQEKRNR
jgi:hypothetical protein